MFYVWGFGVGDILNHLAFVVPGKLYITFFDLVFEQCLCSHGDLALVTASGM